MSSGVEIRAESSTNIDVALPNAHGGKNFAAQFLCLVHCSQLTMPTHGKFRIFVT